MRSPNSAVIVLGFGLLAIAVSAVAEDAPRERWAFETGKHIFGPLYRDGRVYVGSTDGYVYCLDEADGSVAWKTKLDAAVFSVPQIAGGLLFISGSTGSFPNRDTYGPNHVFALAIDDGRLAWNAETGPGFSGSPQSVDGTVVVNAGPFVYAYAAADGKPLWNYKHRTGPVLGVGVADGKAVAVGMDGRVFALRLSDGEREWQQSLDGRSFMKPLIAGQLVIAASMEGTIHALRLADGEVLWTRSTGGGFEGNGIVAKGRFLAGNRAAEIVAADLKTGAIGWSARYTQPNQSTTVFSEACVSDETAILGTFDRRLIAFDVETGERLWTLPISRPYPSLAAGNGTLFYTGAREGVLSAVELP